MKNNSYTTIIIPTFNSEKYIWRTLHSLERQTDQQFQVLIIDDKSIDKTVEIAKSFAKKLRLNIYIKAEAEQAGAAESLNLAFSRVKTPYFALIDSDAYLAKNWLAEMSQTMDEGVDVSGAPILAYKSNSIIGYLVGLELESRYFKLSHRQKVIHASTCNLMGQTKIVKDIRLDTGLKYGYDHQFSYLLNQKNINFTLNKLTLCHHHNKTDITSFLKQQFLIGYHQFRLSLRYPRQAGKKDAISPWYLPLQPILLFASLILVPINSWISLFFLAIVVLLNYNFLSFLIRQKKWSLVPVALLLVLTRSIIWIAAVFTAVSLSIIRK